MIGINGTTKGGLYREEKRNFTPYARNPRSIDLLRTGDRMTKARFITGQYIFAKNETPPQAGAYVQPTCNGLEEPGFSIRYRRATYVEGTINLLIHNQAPSLPQDRDTP